MIKSQKKHFLQLVSAIFLACSVQQINAQESKQTASENMPQKSNLASNACQILTKLPFVGLGKSQNEIKKIIATQEKLLTQGHAEDYQFALSLKEAVAHALIYEMYRSEISRGGIQREVFPKSIPFSKKVFLKLWKTNMPKEKELLSEVLRGEGNIISNIKLENLFEEGMLNGNKLKEMPKASLLRFRKLVEQAYAHTLVGGKSSPDELLVQSLTLIQVLRDLNVIVDIYSKQDLPLNYDSLRSLVNRSLDVSLGRRLDDGMKQSSLKTISMFGRYCSPSFNDKYCIQQSLLLGSYMNDTKELPKQIQSYLMKRKEEEKPKREKGSAESAD